MARHIAIELGSWSVKVGVWSTAGRTPVLEGEYQQRVPQDATTPPSLADRLASLDLILRSHPELGEAHVTEAVWSSERSSVRRMKLPFTDKAQLAQTLPFAIEAEVPFDLDDVVLAWRVGVGDGEVVAALAQEDLVASQIGGLLQRAFDPRRLVPEGELLGRYAPFDDVLTAVVDVGHTHTTVVVARGGRALVWRSIDVAGRSFTRAIADALGCGWGQAEALKHGADEDDEGTTLGGAARDDEPTDPAFGAGLPAKAREALHGAVGLFLAEVRSSLIQFEDELGVGVEEIVLTGGGSRIPELRGWLEQDLGLPVKDPADGDGPVARELAVVRALARDMEGDAPPRVDMRVGELAWKGGLDASEAVIRYGGAFLGSFMMAVITIFVLQYRQLAMEHDLIDGQIRDTVKQVVAELPDDLDTTGAVAMLAEVVGEAEEEAKFLGEPGAVPPMVHELYSLTKAFPAHEQVKVNVDRLEITPNAILINGVTEGLAQVDTIQQSLETDKRYAKVSSESGQRDGQGRLQFTVNIDRGTEDGGEGEDAPEGEEG